METLVSPPLSAPPFHQISLPAPPFPPRKLQAVRFWTHTLSAFQTMIPFRPPGPPSTLGPKFWLALTLLHGAPALVPSTITLLRFMPRRRRRGVLMRMPAGKVSAG